MLRNDDERRVHRSRVGRGRTWPDSLVSGPCPANRPRGARWARSAPGSRPDVQAPRPQSSVNDSRSTHCGVTFGAFRALRGHMAGCQAPTGLPAFMDPLHTMYTIGQAEPGRDGDPLAGAGGGDRARHASRSPVGPSGGCRTPRSSARPTHRLRRTLSTVGEIGGFRRWRRSGDDPTARRPGRLRPGARRGAR